MTVHLPDALTDAFAGSSSATPLTDGLRTQIVFTAGAAFTRELPQLSLQNRVRGVWVAQLICVREALTGTYNRTYPELRVRLPV